MPNNDSRVALVTGASAGIGKQLVRRLLREGWTVYGAARRVEQMADIAAEGARVLRMDVADEASMTSGVQQLLAAEGRIDALVNNAGLFTPKPWDELTIEDWRERFRVNVEGTYLATKAVVPVMEKTGGGKIVNIGSDTVWMGTPGFAHYVASKGAVLGFTRAIATELGPRGITSVYVSPTLLDTPGTRKSFAQGHFDFVLGHTPIGQFEKPEDVTGLVVFLCSDDAKFVNGAAYNIGGGISMH